MENCSKQLSNQLHQYSFYHKNATNILIHTYTIPFIITTSSVLLSFIPLPIFQNLSVLMFMCYCGYYYYLDEELSKELNLYMFGLMFLGYLSTFLNNYFLYNLLISVSCWGLQIAGHKYWEKNQPAFMKSLIESFTIAPIFAYFHLKDDYYKYILKKPLFLSKNKNEKRSKIVHKIPNIHSEEYVIDNYDPTIEDQTESVDEIRADIEVKKND
jgi:2-hydroxy fatty acid dioxygenase